MMNILAIGCLVFSLAAAGVWFPAPEPIKPHDDHLIREGHRLIVVEYERQVLAEHSHPHPHHQLLDEAREKFQEAASVLPNVGQGLSAPLSGDAEGVNSHHSFKEKVCDAYGVCKEKLARVVGKGGEEVSERATRIWEGAEGAAKTAATKASEKAAGIEDNLKDAAKEVAGKVSEKAQVTKDAIKHAAKKVTEQAPLFDDAKSGLKDAAGAAKEGVQDASANILGLAEKGVEKAKESAEMAAAAASDLRQNLTDIVLRARDVVRDAGAYVGAPETVKAVASVAHLLGIAAAYGTCVWVTFVSSHVLATALPRQQFGMVQGKLYPVYFRAVAYGIGLALVAHFFGRDWGRDWRQLPERVQSYNLLAMLGLVVANMLFFEPKATKVMFERMKVEVEEGRGRDMADAAVEPGVAASADAGTATPMGAYGVGRTKAPSAEREAVKCRVAKLNKRLKRLNTYSSFLNILTLMGLTWHLVHLARRLQLSC